MSTLDALFIHCQLLITSCRSLSTLNSTIEQLVQHETSSSSDAWQDLLLHSGDQILKKHTHIVVRLPVYKLYHYYYFLF